MKTGGKKDGRGAVRKNRVHPLLMCPISFASPSFFFFVFFFFFPFYSPFPSSPSPSLEWRRVSIDKEAVAEREREGHCRAVGNTPWRRWREDPPSQDQSTFFLFFFLFFFFFLWTFTSISFFKPVVSGRIHPINNTLPNKVFLLFGFGFSRRLRRCVFKWSRVGTRHWPRARRLRRMVFWIGRLNWTLSSHLTVCLPPFLPLPLVCMQLPWVGWWRRHGASADPLTIPFHSSLFIVFVFLSFFLSFFDLSRASVVRACFSIRTTRTADCADSLGGRTDGLVVVVVVEHTNSSTQLWKKKKKKKQKRNRIETKNNIRWENLLTASGGRDVIRFQVISRLEEGRSAIDARTIGFFTVSHKQVVYNRAGKRAKERIPLPFFKNFLFVVFWRPSSPFRPFVRRPSLYISFQHPLHHPTSGPIAIQRQTPKFCRD